MTKEMRRSTAAERFGSDSTVQQHKSSVGSDTVCH